MLFLEQGLVAKFMRTVWMSRTSYIWVLVLEGYYKNHKGTKFIENYFLDCYCLSALFFTAIILYEVL